MVATPPGTGVYLSVNSGKSFTAIGLKGKIIDVIKVQHRDTQRYVWAGFAATGNDPGEGCVRWQLQDSGASAEGWKSFARGWSAGGCTSLAFDGSVVYAGSRRRGILSLFSESDKPTWREPKAKTAGLPIEALGEFEVIDDIAMRCPTQHQKNLLACGPVGVYRSLDGGKSYQNCSVSEFRDRVTLPPTWLFCSDSHEVSGSYESP